MRIDIQSYLVNSVDRFQIKEIGYMTQFHLPFVVLSNGLTFYGKRNQKKNMIEEMVIGIAEIINDLEFRYFQINRKIKQHFRFTYRPGDVVVELGAYLGFYSMFIANSVGPRGRVIAVEMIPENYEILKMNLKTNFPENTIVINCGVHNESGHGKAYVGGKQLAGFRKDVISKFAATVGEINVKMDTVDNILQEYQIDSVDLMIIQVNGNEIEALQGMTNSINRVRNFAIAAPYNHKGIDHQYYIGEFLRGNGFDVSFKYRWVFAQRCQ